MIKEETSQPQHGKDDASMMMKRRKKEEEEREREDEEERSHTIDISNLLSLLVVSPFLLFHCCIFVEGRAA